MDDLTKLIQGFEGCRLFSYTDTVGKLTIGWGRNLADKGITQAEADAMLENDITDVSIAVANALPWVAGLTENRQNVILCMAFQMGIAGLLEFKNTLQAVQNGDYQAAADGMLASLWAQQTPTRAQTLANMMING